MSRIVANIATNSVLQVEKTPEVGDPRPFNGRFLLPVPDGAAVEVTGDSYILPQDGGDLAAEAAAALLARFPMYSHIVYNFLLEAADVADLDLSAAPAVTAISGTTVRTRAQTGRGAGPGPTGQCPTTTAILPLNDRIAPSRPGMLVTNAVDIGPVTGGGGADEFMVWWQIYTFSTDEDIASDFGVFSGDNTPATRSITEIDQEPAGFAVFISHDNGTTWTPISRLEPTDLTVFGTMVRLAFVNGTSTKAYLAAYAFLF